MKGKQHVGDSLREQTFRTIAIAATLLIGGCVSVQETDYAGPPSSALLAEVNSTNEIPASEIHFKECEGSGAFVRSPTRAGVDMRVPPGWEAQEPYVLLAYRSYTCQRIHMGDLERGPVNIVFETHNGVDAPQSCNEAHPGSIYALLYSMGSDDPEVSSWLSEAFGLPTWTANLTWNETTIGTTTSWSSSLQSEQGTTSWTGLMLTDATRYPASLSRHTTMYFMADGNLSAFLLTADVPVAADQVQYGLSQWAAPMLASVLGPRDNVASTNRFLSGDMHIRAETFGDLYCSAPE